MQWYSIVSKDISRLHDAISYYNAEYISAKSECQITGTLEKISQALPGMVEHRFAQLQDIDAILNLLNIERNKIYKYEYEKYLLSYQKTLKSTEIEKFVRGEDSIAELDILINDVALIRNLFTSITKGLDTKQWQVTNITKLRVAGLDDATLS